MFTPRYLAFYLFCSLFTYGSLAQAALLFEEDFENASFSSKGWYDSTGGVLSTTEHIPGSLSSFECKFLQGGTGCSGGSPLRHLFTATESLYVSYWVKYSSTYVGSGQSFHPHEIYVLSNRDGTYAGLSTDYLTFYIEQGVSPSTGALIPRLEIQDAMMVAKPTGTDLRATTENRAVAGCNGPSNTGGVSVDGVDGGTDCYATSSSPSGYYSNYAWLSPTARISKNAWHHVEVYAAMNSISSGGIGQTDGVLKYWLDDTLVIDRSTVMFRTGANPTLAFSQFVLAPYIGSGSPIEQTWWIDNLTVMTSKPTYTQDTTPPAAPQNLRVF